MNDTFSIKSPAALDLVDRDGGIYHGGSQMWFAQRWRRMSGCGPTNAATLIWYLARTRTWGKGLWDAEQGGKDAFIALMNTMFDYVKPGMMGVNSTAIFQEGVLRFGEERHIPLHMELLEVPQAQVERPDFGTVAAFLQNALERDLAVAFLNLSNGSLHNLDNWHWVTLIGFTPEQGRAVMLDQCHMVDIDLKQWLYSTTRGGGFVALDRKLP